MFPKLFKVFQNLRYDLSASLLKYYDKKKKGITAYDLEIPLPMVPKSIIYLPYFPNRNDIDRISWHIDAHTEATKKALLGFFEGKMRIKKLPSIFPT